MRPRIYRGVRYITDLICINALHIAATELLLGLHKFLYYCLCVFILRAAVGKAQENCARTVTCVCVYFTLCTDVHVARMQNKISGSCLHRLEG